MGRYCHMVMNSSSYAHAREVSLRTLPPLPSPATAMEPPRGEGEPWKVLEFYSGIGGMRYSLIESGVSFEIVEAFDINDKANDVYEFNFGHRPCQGNIQSLTASDLDRYGAHAWLLSPPCQPYTRQGLRKESGDARASSFLKILSVISSMFRPPHILFVENVVGFETSDTHKQMLDLFFESGFNSQEFILTPLQFGIPYSRPRYFCLAKRKPSLFFNPTWNNQLLWTFKPLQKCQSASSDIECGLDDDMGNQSSACEPIGNFLETKMANIIESDCSSEVKNEMMFEQLRGGVDRTLDEIFQVTLQDISTCQHGQAIHDYRMNAYRVPFDLIERWGNVMDIVYPDSKRCCCFTKSYYRYVKGTGSFLATLQCMEKNPSKVDISFLKTLGLRYFTPREVANLHSFPKCFSFPDNTSLKQRYALLGNSLSVAVVGPLLRYLFTEPYLTVRG